MTDAKLFAGLPTIACYDPLAQFLGASADGVLEYAYSDCVKFAGHSCPTVAGAYLMTLRALERLYPGGRPVRGDLRVEHSGAKDQGANGVCAAVAAYICGAADEGGFKGLGGRYARNGRLFFSAGFAGALRFTRLDTGAGVTADYDPSGVPGDPEMPRLMQVLFAGGADDEHRRRFGWLWQDRVARIIERELKEGGLVGLREAR